MGYLASSAEVGIDTEFELIRAKARYLVSKISRDITYANLEASLGRIYNSVGLDALPSAVDSHETSALAVQMQARLTAWEDENFSPKPASLDLPVMIGEIEGVPAADQKEFRAAIVRILELSKIHVAEGDAAKLKINSGVFLDAPRDGGRPARVRVALLDAVSGESKFSSEFKTTLSEPVDLPQWRTLGEGAAYRIVGPVARLRTGRVLTQKKSSSPADGGELKLARSTAVSLPGGHRADPAAIPAGTLSLRYARELGWPAVEPMSKIEINEGRRAQ